tara:strand:- start:1786 stop:2682 length:897 start_codon:yes stop_codon:yes gene_type:complete
MGRYSKLCSGADGLDAAEPMRRLLLSSPSLASGESASVTGLVASGRLRRHCATGAVLLQQYARRVRAPGGELKIAQICAMLGLIAGALDERAQCSAAQCGAALAPASDAADGTQNTRGAFASFDCFSAISLMLVGEVPGSLAALEALSEHPVSAFVWPALGERLELLEPPLQQLLVQVESLVAKELPALFTAMRIAGVSITLPAARWLQQCWLNVLPWEALVEALLLPLLHGADFQVYLCVAVFQHIEADVLARCHSGDLLPFLLGYPIRGFKPAMVLPFLVRLCERHRERVMRSLRI